MSETAKAEAFLLSLNQGLAEKVAGLDRDHYPGSLIEILEAVLLDQTSPRGLPLIAASIDCSGPDAGDVLQAAEVVWQGLLMTAVIAVGVRPTDGLAAGLAESYDTAHRLLAADTLLTWPFEFVPADEGAPDAVGALALSGRNALGQLASCGKGFRGLLDWQPLEVLLEAVCQERFEKAGGDMLRLSFLADLRRWLGMPPWLAEAWRSAAESSGQAELDEGLLAVRDMLTE